MMKKKMDIQIKDYTAWLKATSLEAVFSDLENAEQQLEEAKQKIDAAQRSNDETAKKQASGDKKKAEAAIKKHCHDLARIAPSKAYYYLSATKRADADGVRTTWQDSGQGESITNQWSDQNLLEIFANPKITLDELPPLSFHLSFEFTLVKPFLSRDDDPFYIIDNPVTKDKVFKRPFVSPSSWKGALRSAARYVIDDGGRIEGTEQYDSRKLERLFGPDKDRMKGEQNPEFFAGRLRFFPTFFRQIRQEVINPHCRQGGAGTLPILFETADGKGQFNLLYLPFELVPTAYEEVAEDLESTINAVEAMFTVYGFGAKTSDGFGVTEKAISGRLSLRLEEAVKNQNDIDDKPLTLFGGVVPVQIGKKPKQKRDFSKADLPLIKAVSVRPFESFRVSKKSKGLIEAAKELANLIRSKERTA